MIRTHMPDFTDDSTRHSSFGHLWNRGVPSFGSMVFTARLKPLFMDSILASVKNMFLMREATLGFGAPWDWHLGGSFLQSRVGEQRQLLTPREKELLETHRASVCVGHLMKPMVLRETAVLFYPVLLLRKSRHGHVFTIRK